MADRTRGWACGVRRAAVALSPEPADRGRLDGSDRALEDTWRIEVLGEMTASVRSLLVWTSIVEVVPPGAVRPVLGAGDRQRIDRAIADIGLIQRSPDGSLTCHPLLRAAARPCSRSSDPRRRRAGAPAASSGGSPTTTSRRRRSSCAWPRGTGRGRRPCSSRHTPCPGSLAGTAERGRESGPPARPEVRAAEPLLNAAVPLARQDLLGRPRWPCGSTTCRSAGRAARAGRRVPAARAGQALGPRRSRTTSLLPRARQLLAQAVGQRSPGRPR